MIAASAVVALPLATLLWLSGATHFALALAAMLVLALVVWSTGLLALRAVDAADLPAPAAWVLGVFVTMLSLYALVEMFNLLAFTAFAIWAAVVAGLAFTVHRRAGPGRPMQAAELVALLACGAATVLWCREIAEAPQKWAQFHADLKAAIDAGMDPTEPKAQELARRWWAIVSAFTGGDEGIYRSLKNMYQSEPNVMGTDTAAMKPGMDWLMKAAAAAGIKVPS